jgi:very-short-patch-repair endonuclease
MRRRSAVTSVIEQYGRHHRSSLHGPEQALWAELRGGRLGVWFKRQVVISRYIVDLSLRESVSSSRLNGGYHAQRESADARGDRKLARLGYRAPVRCGPHPS